MATRVRVAVVGDGIIGWSTAFELARRGADVSVYRGAGSGAATGASAGILAPYTEAHHQSPLLRLAVRGLSIYDDFVGRVRAASSMPFEYRHAGTLEVADRDDRAVELQQRPTTLVDAASGIHWLAPERLRAEAPFIREGCAGALACPFHRYVNVQSFVAALEDASARAGVTSIAGPARAIEVGPKGLTVMADEEQRYDSVVLAAGAWTPDVDPLGRTAGRIRPVRGQLVRLRSPRLRGAPIVWGSDCYIVPWQDGTVLVGATVEEAGFEVRATADGVRGLLDAAVALVPALSAATFVDVRVGLRPASDEEMPILGPGEDPRIVYAVGHFRNGVLLAPLTAQILASFILEGVEDPAFTAATLKKGA